MHKLLLAILLTVSTSAFAANAVGLTERDVPNIPFSDRIDDQGNPDKDSQDFIKNWQGKTITLRFGGIKLGENYVTCSPQLKGYGRIKPETLVTGTLISRDVGGSGGNPIGLKNCKLVK